MQKLDGKLVAESVRHTIKQETAELSRKNGVKPGLAVVLVGENPASQVYVGSKIKACEEVGFSSFEHRLPANSTEESLLKLIKKLNDDPLVHGILVQLPLPQHFDESKVIGHISPYKDVDCLTSENSGKLFQSKQKIAPCTPSGVMEILKYYKYNVQGWNAVVVGRSQIVGLPMAQLLIQANATVTVAHSKTQNLKDLTVKADLVVAALGKPQFLDQTFFKKEAVVIDVGIHRLDGKKLCGDVRSEGLSVQAFTPVPGGVGPMTIAILLKNTLQLFKISHGVN